jgi:hypothetical protein
MSATSEQSARREALASLNGKVVSLQRHACKVSEWKLTESNPVHRVLPRLYMRVSKRMLWLFGNLMVVAENLRTMPAMFKSTVRRPS